MKYCYVFVLISLCTVIYAQGGPPMLTDDPATVEKGHWEINNAITLEHTSGSDAFEIPLEDFNYGLTDNIHLKYEMPVVLIHNYGSPAIGGIGKSSVGAKMRFYSNEKSGISFSTYPQFAFNNNAYSSRREITEKGVEFLLPLSFMYENKCNSIVLEAGREFTSRDRGSWLFGALYNMKLTKRTEIAAELFENSDYGFSANEIILNAGLRFRLSKHFVFLFSAGDNFILHDGIDNTFISYFGLQLQL